jgi:GST-like protein
VYLAAKTGKFLPRDTRAWVEVLQWLFWQVAGLGPMAGQNHHFVQYAPEKIPYAMDRYVRETARLYAVLDKRLSDREYVAGDYSIADMACYPWIVPHQRQQQNLDDFRLKRWFEAIRARPAVVVPTEGKSVNTRPVVDEQSRRILFARTLSREALNLPPEAPQSALGRLKNKIGPTLRHTSSDQVLPDTMRGITDRR